METVEAWRRRKREEIGLLASRVSDPPDPGDLAGPDEVTAAKLAVRARLHAMRIADDLVETNRLDAESLPLDPFELRWRYQRFDLVVKGPSPYPGLMEDRPTVWTTRFTSSGMGAIGPLLLAFQQRGEHPAVVVHADAYFETLDILRTLTPKIAATIVPAGGDLVEPARQARTRGADVVIAWLDSYSVDDPIDAIAGLATPDADHVVVDTTCYEAGSPRIRALTDRGLAAGSPVTLVRSHLKLDGLGIEYGRLGSVVHVATPMLPPARFDAYRHMRVLDASVGRLVGATAVPGHLNPYLADPGFHALNKERVERIAAANDRAGAALSQAFAGTPIAVRTFHHHLFVALGPWNESIGSMRVREALDAVVARLRSQGHAVRLANSFGFDFVAAAPFVDPLTRHDQIRMAVPDWPDPWLDAFVADLIALFRDTTWG